MQTDTYVDPEEPPLRPAPPQQLRTYHGFLIALRYIVLAHIVGGTFLILTFCTATPWPGAFVIALVELIIGLWFARDRQTVGAASEMATLVMTTAAESGRHYRPERRADYHGGGMHPAE
jgi:hypothetical protein